AIKSRTSGEYSISSLYKLGSYSGKGGMFARQKVQGFMRVPIPGYVVTSSKKAMSKTNFRLTMIKTMFGKTDTSLSRLDAGVLFLRSGRYGWRNVEEKELVRAGVIADNTYHPERMQEYVGSRLFDWNIGSGSTTVAVINASGENGLGSDIADFLTNLGLDVVMVRSVNGDSQVEKSEWQVGNEKIAHELGYIFKNLFGFNEAKLEKVSEEYRSMVLIRIGKDAKELF
nr:LytR C-terminal domain-containing protein [Candidatus Woesebacteria bacterium]